MATKDEVLSLLARAGGKAASGQALAKALGVSRTAIWKAIESLRADGFEIRAATNRGYQLVPGDERLSRQGICAYLPRELGDCPITVFDRIDSTNTQAKRMAADGAPHGTLVAAREQTAGRGRQGRSFFSPKDTGLYMSVILRPEQAGMTDAQMITVAAAVAVNAAIEAVTGVNAQIKWVNDLYVRGRKVCGILTEAVSDFESGRVESIVLGAGVNMTTTDFPEGLGTVPGALGCAHVSPNRLAAAIYTGILGICGHVADPWVLQAYRERSLLLGRPISFVRDGQTVPATALEINERGNLVVRLEDGSLQTLFSGEVSVRL